MVDPRPPANPLFLREEDLRAGIELLFYAYRDFTGEADHMLEKFGLGRAHHRAIYFIAQHLVLVVPREALLDHLHQAYERLSFAGAGYGLFISGPSKTADIEQSLVIGAHGARSLTVLLAP